MGSGRGGVWEGGDRVCILCNVLRMLQAFRGLWEENAYAQSEELCTGSSRWAALPSHGTGRGDLTYGASPLRQGLFLPSLPHRRSSASISQRYPLSLLLFQAGAVPALPLSVLGLEGPESSITRPGDEEAGGLAAWAALVGTRADTGGTRGE